MTTFTVETVDPQPAAVVRAEVPMAELREVFDRGFTAIMQAVRAQAVAIVGPPFGYYPRMPGETVAVLVGFPVASAIAAVPRVACAGDRRLRHIDGNHSKGPTPMPAPLHWPLERVLFALAGTMTLLSAGLAATVSPWFLLLTGFVGVNQWLYVAVGACPASLVLGRLLGLQPCRSNPTR
jgi:hypothetical protein